MGLPSLDITGKGGHTARVSGDAGRGATFSVVPLFMPKYGEDKIFENQKTSIFVN